jgi:hypothetical protein
MKGEGYIRRLAFLRRRWPVPLAICAIFRNEARYLPEWIEFHQRQGADRFYLYDNDSDDGWQEALAPYRDVIELHPWPKPRGQLAAYGDCIRRHRWDSRWIAFIDVDEFLFSPAGRLPDVLARFKRASAVCANWRVYGTSGHVEPAEGRVTDVYVRRAEDNHPLNRHVKSIVFPPMTGVHVENPHFFPHYTAPVGERGDRVHGPFRDPPTADLLRINHYYTRSQSEYGRKRKAPRADTDDPRPEFDIGEFDVVDDPLALQDACT